MMIRSGLFSLAALLGVAACVNQETILPGERLDIRGAQAGAPVVAVNQSKSISLPTAVNYSGWPQRAGDADHRLQQPAFSASPVQVWSADIGQGNDRKRRITADPVAANGRIFTLDSGAGVVATATNGSTLWSRDLTPVNDDAGDASGGGLAVVNGQLFVTTGFGDLVALDPADGSEIWRQRLEGAATGAPTVSGGLVYVVTRDSRAWAIDATDGRVRWQLSSPPSVTGIVGGSAPAVGKGLVIFPFGSAELVAAFPKGGLQIWRRSISGARLGRAYAQISDVTGDPVLAGNVVYAGNPSGRTVALDVTTGEEIWSVAEGATGPVWVDGGSVFFMTDRAELVRLDARNGKRIWGVQLPNVVPARNPSRERDVFAHFGPVLAGGLLWVASGDEQLRGFDPVDGAQRVATPLAGGASTRPIVVNGVMYIVSAGGKLLAFR